MSRAAAAISSANTARWRGVDRSDHGGVGTAATLCDWPLAEPGYARRLAMDTKDNNWARIISRPFLAENFIHGRCRATLRFPWEWNPLYILGLSPRSPR